MNVIDRTHGLPPVLSDQAWLSMARYKCHKEVYATPMNRGDYNDYRGWAIPADENPADEGYLVIYNDGYESWSPKQSFDEGYTFLNKFLEKKKPSPDPLPDASLQRIGECLQDEALMDCETFGVALAAAKAGKRIRRLGWNGKGMFAYYVEGGNYPTQHPAAQAHFGDTAPYRPYLALKTAQEDVTVWTPSTSDILANDWEILK